MSQINKGSFIAFCLFFSFCLFFVVVVVIERNFVRLVPYESAIKTVWKLYVLHFLSKKKAPKEKLNQINASIKVKK